MDAPLSPNERDKRLRSSLHLLHPEDALFVTQLLDANKRLRLNWTKDQVCQSLLACNVDRYWELVDTFMKVQLLKISWIDNLSQHQNTIVVDTVPWPKILFSILQECNATIECDGNTWTHTARGVQPHSEEWTIENVCRSLMVCKVDLYFELVDAFMKTKLLKIHWLNGVSRYTTSVNTLPWTKMVREILAEHDASIECDGATWIHTSQATQKRRKEEEAMAEQKRKEQMRLEKEAARKKYHDFIAQLKRQNETVFEKTIQTHKLVVAFNTKVAINHFTAYAGWPHMWIDKKVSQVAADFILYGEDKRESVTLSRAAAKALASCLVGLQDDVANYGHLVSWSQDRLNEWFETHLPSWHFPCADVRAARKADEAKKPRYSTEDAQDMMRLQTTCQGMQNMW